MNLWPLLGVVLVVAGFALRLNPALVVVTAGVVTGLVAGFEPLAVLALLGEAFVTNRYLALFLLTLPVIGLLERHGLKQHAQAWVARLRGATTGRLLIAYLALRQIAATLGLTSLGGHPQTVRPLVAPMAEGAALVRYQALPHQERERIKALSAATDNVGLFFGEDIFIAFGAVLLMQGFLAENGIVVEPLAIALWGIPTAIAAFTIHAVRLTRYDRHLDRTLRATAHAANTPPPSAPSSPQPPPVGARLTRDPTAPPAPNPPERDATSYPDDTAPDDTAPDATNSGNTAPPRP